MSGLASEFVRPMLASLTVGPLQFETPFWSWLIPIGWAICVAIVVLRGGNLSGLGSVTRWTALAVRLLVVALISMAMAEPQWCKESKDVAVTVVLDASDSVPLAQYVGLTQYVRDAAEKGKSATTCWG